MTSKSFIKKFMTRLDKVDSVQLTAFIKKISEDVELFYQILDHNHDGIVVLNARQQVEYVNSRALEILRFDLKEQLLGKPLEEVVYNPDFKRYLKSKMEHQEPIRDEEHVIGSPHIRVIRVNFFFIRDNANSITHAVLKLTDITRKKLEEIKNRRAENITSMGHLAAGLAHEIKNPLASVDIHLKLLSRYLKNAPDFQDKADMEHFIGVLQEEVFRLTDIVQDFLSAIRPISLDLRRVSVADLIQDLVQFLELELKENQIHLEVTIEDNLPSVLGDQKYLRIVFLNLVKNAIEAFEPEKHDRKILIKLSENYPFVEVLVQDNGPGIPPERLEKVFEPYFTTKSSGTGIGLTMVHKIVTEHSGNIKVESQKDKGTAFTLMLPQYQGETTKFLENPKGEEGTVPDGRK